MTVPAGLPVVLLRRQVTSRDAFGNDVYVETATVVLGAFAPGSSAEAVQGQDTVVTQPTLYLPAGSDVSAVDAVVVAPTLVGGQPARDEHGVVLGERFTVDGTPSVWRSPFSGWQPGVEVRLRRVTG